MSRKAEVRELTKPDAFQNLAEKAPEWWKNVIKTHQTTLALAAGLVVLIAGGITYSLSRMQTINEKASQALAEAQEVFQKQPKSQSQMQLQGGDAKDAFKTNDEWHQASEEKFNKIAADYGRSGAAQLSQLYLAALAMEKGDAAGAEKYYRAYINAGKDKDLAAVARLGLAAALEDQKKYDDALGEYQKLAPAPGDKAPPALSDQALLAMARLHERQGRVQEAKAAYERLAKEFPQSMAGFKAQSRAAALAQ